MGCKKQAADSKGKAGLISCAMYTEKDISLAKCIQLWVRFIWAVCRFSDGKIIGRQRTRKTSEEEPRRLICGFF